MAYDFKKEFKEFYIPKTKPEIVTVPSFNYLSVQGIGDPNEEDGEYKKAIKMLYSVAYTLKMSYKGNYKIDGFFEYVVPPLEGFWWQNNIKGVDYTKKESFNWISVIRLPDFISETDVKWAIETLAEKKKGDCSRVKFITLEEGLCIQMMHIGPFDEEPATIAAMDSYLKDREYRNDITDKRMHHEIYLSDINKVEPSKWKTVIRHPISKI